MFKRIASVLLLLSPLCIVAQHIAIGERTFKFNDTSRSRPVTTEIWYPTNDVYQASDSSYTYPFVHIPVIRNAHVQTQKRPLVMISHGTGGGRITLEWLADALVQKGFIVAAVDHWGNTYDNPIAIDFVTPWQRPQDISFAITQLLNDKDFGAVIDKDRIGAAGFSIGGYTVVALAGGKLSLKALEGFSKTSEGIKEMTIPEFPNLASAFNKDEVWTSFKSSPDLMDKRIKAFFAICPAGGQGFVSEDQVSRINKPFYIVGAQSDSIAPVKTNAAYYHQLIKGSKLLIIPGKVGHYVFLNEGAGDFKKQGGIYTNDDPSIDRRAVHQQVGNLATEFFMKNLK
jgi:predicted dienelactone hydrolase